MHRLRYLLTVVTGLSLVAICGCGDGDTLAAGAPTSRAMQEIPEGFDFLPPLHATKGLTTFNAQATPIVLVYAGTEANKGALLKRFETADITVETDHFHVNWDTNAEPGGLPDGTPNCVVEVWWETAGACDQMGFVDCIVDKPAGKGKKSSDPADYFFDLKDGRTLPIKFVIDQTVPAPVDITVTGIDPASAEQGTTLDATITGTGFKPGALVSLGAGITVNSVAWVSASSLTVNLTLAADATPGLRDVTVTNPQNKVAALSGGFEVEAPSVLAGYEFVASWGSHGSGNTQLFGPIGIAVDSGGSVYVGDENNHRLVQYDSNGTYLGQWGTLGSGNGQFDRVYGVAVDTAGFVYAADHGNNRVQKFDSAGNFVSKWGSAGNGAGQFNGPAGVYADSFGHVYVTDFYNIRVQAFTTSGAHLLTFGSYGTEDGQLRNPYGVSTDADGNVYVADNGLHRVQKFSPAGEFLLRFGSNGTADGQFRGAVDVCALPDGSTLVCDFANHRVQLFDPTGAFVLKFGSQGSGEGQFNYPRGVAVDSEGYVYIADNANDRIQKFRPVYD